MERGTILDEAKQIINGERQDQYGAPEDSFKVIGGYWSNYLNTVLGSKLLELTSKDVALMMTLFKIAREQGQGKRDNLIDACGYLGIAADIDEKL